MQEHIEEEQGVDLRECLRTIKERKEIVFGITSLSFLISLLFVLFMQPVYESKALIEMAKIQNVPIENAAKLSVLFKNSVNPYLKEIVKAMDVDEKDSYALVKSYDIRDNMGYLAINGRSRTPADAKKLVDTICFLIVKRGDELIKEALDITDEEVMYLNKQTEEIKNEIEEVRKKIKDRENTSVLAQSYVFQSFTQSKQNSFMKLLELSEKLRSKKMEIRYYTKSAKIIAQPSLPVSKYPQNRKQIILISTLIGFIISIFVIFIGEFIKNNVL